MDMDTEKIHQEIKKWAESSHAYLSSRTPFARGYAKGYLDGITHAKEIILDILNKTE